MEYIISFSNPEQHFIDIEFKVDVAKKESIEVQLPAWRPGRYELGNFAKNIQKWQAYNEKGKELCSEKLTKDRWLVHTGSAEKLIIKYNYYANELNAGSTYLDETQLYMNPVNCLLYLEELQDKSCKVTLELPKDYKVATGLKQTKKHHFKASTFHELVDCPFVASDTLQHASFKSKGTTFNIWFQGECKPDTKRIVNDFKLFTEKQIEIFGEFPVDEYHYLCHIVPFNQYHGVEHYNSTVIALGPSYDLMEKYIYDELLGVSCHELFHTWNIKQIRPAEMYPYDYTKENYSKLGYVAEGVTTYYGDLLLHRSELFNDEEFFKLFALQIQRHFDNFAHTTYSVAQSSFDTWLDGYVKGVPNRKLSIYSDGFLISFMTDVLIMEATNHKKSLDDVMYILYHDFAKKDKGYTDRDYMDTVSKIAGKDLSEFLQKHAYQKGSYKDELTKCLDYVGLEIKYSDSDNTYETDFGFKATPEGEVTDVYPDSIAYKNGIAVGDKITHINSYQLDKNLAKWSRYFRGEEVHLVVQHKFGRASVLLKPTKKKYYQKIGLVRKEDLSKKHTANFLHWKFRD